MPSTSPAGQRDELRLLSGIVRSFDGTAAIEVLDCGGGTGRTAVPLAQLGAQVTVVDISVDALATLSRRAAEAGVGERVHPVQGDLEALTDAVGSAAFDLALLHGVLDVVDPTAALLGVHEALRPGGLVSVLVTNPAAEVLAKVLAGELEAAVTALQAGDELGAEVIARRCRAIGFSVEGITGVGVFSDLIGLGSSGNVVAAGQSVAELAAELEVLGSSRSPFREIAGRLHVLARRSPAGSTGDTGATGDTGGHGT